MGSELIETVRRFYEAHRQELYTYALALTRCASAAEDALHTAFSGLLRRRTLPAELRPYVFRSVRNAALDELRANHRAPAGESVFAAKDPVAAAEARDRLDALLASLADDERECIVLKALNGLTLKEVAAIRRVSINTAASWYRRGIEKMRAAVKEEDL